MFVEKLEKGFYDDDKLNSSDEEHISTTKTNKDEDKTLTIIVCRPAADSSMG